MMTFQKYSRQQIQTCPKNRPILQMDLTVLHQLAGFVTTGAVPTAGFSPVVPDELPKPKINQHTQILISIINRGPDSPPEAPSEQRERAALVLVSFHVEGQVVRSGEPTATRCTGKVWPLCASWSGALAHQSGRIASRTPHEHLYGFSPATKHRPIQVEGRTHIW